MRLRLAVTHRLPSFALELDVERTARVLALVGASGSGKTTLLNVIAGLVKPQSGRVSVDGTTLLDTAAGLNLPVHRRRIGYVFQDGRLFPHLTVQQNLGYGRWFAPRKPAATWEREVLGLLGIAHLMGRRTGALSGGERQRVAIGRALMTSPDLLLMDEPLAALDESRRDDLMGLIEALRDHARVPIIYVSHSRAEVSRLADEVLVLRQGALVRD